MNLNDFDPGHVLCILHLESDQNNVLNVGDHESRVNRRLKEKIGVNVSIKGKVKMVKSN